MGEYTLSLAADQDLADIYLYSQQNFGEVQADTYFLGLSTCLDTLALNPHLGRKAAVSSESMMKHAHASHVIYYLIEGAGIFVVRILHSSMERERHLNS